MDDALPAAVRILRHLEWPALCVRGVSDILVVYSKVWATTLGKALLLLLYALSTTAAYALAAQLVNEVVAFETSMLDNAVVFVAILLVPIFVFISTYVLFALVFLFGQLYLILVAHADVLKHDECFKSVVPKNLERYPFKTLAARAIIYPVALGFLWGSASHMLPRYGSFIETSAASFIYHLEAVRFSRCSNVPIGAKVIPVNDTEIIVVRWSDGEYSFEPMACDPKISSNNSFNPTGLSAVAPRPAR
ncbi:hypothetical protein QWY84_07740 [Aquisalimonas lutea]|uniref:hypothetical protein n=1 Tax=Aquisalimonas lutea TaxID=1327750 RepID=UPI0025B471DA|nr:hypothetical protein [Aquisalimonas lutea]MDN3517495.1 hypothetical protein [Aquisalimonas lutea]